jgi:hypothetical protein
MAGGAGNRAMGFAGALFRLVALDALQVHHLFGFHCALFLHFFDGIGFLGKDTVADHYSL